MAVSEGSEEGSPQGTSSSNTWRKKLFYVL